ncbi:hypothetical protein BN8_06454 [Fibrisoma limi BUZ 3]|uniref:KWG Leptospira repeat protein n=1 Tax=Fibrisoma limi BUZ 3 TaxID=1185876 RepID=I2GT26_9BACT|nr:WG repeat-containing protein [Fibrisoma limi]CCH57055.1 hypothetical protein BN8_06454 [Fibrisoma limi BUZ 3]
MKLLYVVGAISLLWMLRYAWMFVRQRTDTEQALSADEQQAIPPDALFPVPVNTKWGYINGRRKLVIPPTYTTANDFYDDRAVVQQVVYEPSYSRTYSVIDPAGNVITDQPYDRILDYSEGFAAVQENETWGFIDKQGKLIIPCRYEDAGYFSEGLACVKLNGKNGFIDKQGNMIIKPQFERLCYVSTFKEGLAAVYLTHDDGPSGYIDRSGNFKIPPEFSFVEPFADDLALVRSLNSGFIGFINRKGKWVVQPTKYEDAHSFREGLATVATLSSDRKRWQWSVIDKTGKTVANVSKYRSTGVFANGLCAVQSEESRTWGFIDKQGREVIPTRYTGITSIFRNGLARMETGSLFGGLETVYITPKGTVFWRGK